jgi:hypothetical protein
VRPVETISGTRGEGIKENDGGVNSSMICSKNFCNCHNVPTEKQQKRKIKPKMNKEIIQIIQYNILIALL